MTGAALRSIGLGHAILGLALVTAAGCGPNFKDTANLNSSGTSIVCFGDSITRGYGATQGADYPSRLGELIGRPVVNAGVDGDTTADALRRIERDVLDHDPWIVVIELGGNDLLQHIPESETRSNLTEIARTCSGAGAIVVLVHAKFGILMSDPYIDAYEAVSESELAVLIRDSLGGILGNPSRMYDQIHPNDAGYAVLAERVAAVVGPLISASESARL